MTPNAALEIDKLLYGRAVFDYLTLSIELANPCHDRHACALALQAGISRNEPIERG